MRPQHLGTEAEEEKRRAGTRRAVAQEVCLFDETGEPMVLESLDLGPRGVFVRSDVLLEPDQELWVSLNVPGGPKLVVKGRVVRGDLGAEGGPPGMGIAFVDLTAREEGWLRRFCENELAHQNAWETCIASMDRIAHDARGEAPNL